MKRYYVLFILMILTIPVFLGVNVLQSIECGVIRNEIRKLEKSQEDCLNNNKAIAGEITDLLAIDKLEAEAKKMGLQKVRPEDVLVIIMGGKGRGL